MLWMVIDKLCLPRFVNRNQKHHCDRIKFTYVQSTLRKRAVWNFLSRVLCGSFYVCIYVMAWVRCRAICLLDTIKILNSTVALWYVGDHFMTTQTILKSITSASLRGLYDGWLLELIGTQLSTEAEYTSVRNRHWFTSLFLSKFQVLHMQKSPLISQRAF